MAQAYACEFEGIAGNAGAKRLLQQHVDQQSLFKFYAFVGPKGVGKFLFARAFIKAWMPTGHCSNQSMSCTTCGKIDRLSCPDFTVVSSEKEIGVDQIRELESVVRLRPYGALRKAAIIRGDNGITSNAQNALLKLAEEPKGKCVIILLANSRNQLMETILSRACVVPFTFLREDEGEGLMPGNVIYAGRVMDEAILGKYKGFWNIYLNAARAGRMEGCWYAPLEPDFLVFARERVPSGLFEVHRELERLYLQVVKGCNPLLTSISFYQLMLRLVENEIV